MFTIFSFDHMTDENQELIMYIAKAVRYAICLLDEKLTKLNQSVSIVAKFQVLEELTQFVCLCLCLCLGIVTLFVYVIAWSEGN